MMCFGCKNIECYNYSFQHSWNRTFMYICYLVQGKWLENLAVYIFFILPCVCIFVFFLNHH